MAVVVRDVDVVALLRHGLGTTKRHHLHGPPVLGHHVVVQRLAREAGYGWPTLLILAIQIPFPRQVGPKPVKIDRAAYRTPEPVSQCGKEWLRRPDNVSPIKEQ
jgi:hypothetical protein